MSDRSERNRAPRNRTLTVTDAERSLYGEKVYRPAPDSALTPEIILGKTINGDFLELAPRLPGKFADLAILDPPYNLTKNFHGNTFTETTPERYALMADAWFSALKPILKDEASVYVCCDWQSSPAIYASLSRHFTVRNRITWQREKGRGAKSNWKNCSEDVWFATAGNAWTFNVDAVKLRRKVLAPYRADGRPKDWEESDGGRYRLTHPSNFWDDISIPYWSMPENTDHPTQKPEKLIARLILASSNPGDVVFDPFLGSGTTSVTAKKLGRLWCGTEINGEYCVWAVKRLARADGEKTIQGYAHGVFWERNTRIPANPAESEPR